MKYVIVYLRDGRVQKINAESIDPILDCGYFLLKCKGREIYITEAEIEAVEIIDDDSTFDATLFWKPKDFDTNS